MAAEIKKAGKAAPGRPFEPGHGKRGRPPGTPNKIPAAVKDMILEALAGAGGVEYLKKQASKNPQAFMMLVGKVLPLQIQGDKDNPLHSITEVRETIVDPANP